MTDPTQPIPGSPPTPETAAIHRALADLRQQVGEVRRLQASGRRWVYGTTLLGVVLFTVFTLGTYVHIRRNFDQASVQQAISQHGDEMVPITMKLLMLTGQNVMPAYREAVVGTLHARGPAAAKDAVARLQQLPERSGKEFQDKVAAAFDAAVRRVQPDFRAAFPSITDERRQQLMQAFVMDQIDAQNKRVAARVGQLYTNDLIHMQGVLEKFDVPDGRAAGPGGEQALERRFLHTMVALLDDQVDAAFPAGPAADRDRDADAQTAAVRLTAATPATQPAVH